MVSAFESPVGTPAVDFGTCRLTDESAAAKWRTWTDRFAVGIGKARRSESVLALSVTPGEWIEVSGSDAPAAGVDVTHVRAMFRLTGPGARPVLEHVCALDLSDLMTPNLAAARTLVAGVATELVREDIDGELSYLLLVSRSFAAHTWDRLVAAAGSRSPRE